MTLRESGEDYLETILILTTKKGYVRSVDIANEMNVSKPSVCRAVKLLKSGGYILIDESGYITFTETGKQRAENIYARHKLLTELLIGIGVNKDTAAEDACRIEHDISEETFEKLKEHLGRYLKKK